jgi:Phophatidylserine decarboxylase
LPVTGSEDPRINAMLKELLTAWCEFLGSRDSLDVLNDSPDREGEGEA